MRETSTKDTYCVILFIWNIQNRQIYRYRELISDCCSLGEGMVERHRVSFWGNGNVLKFSSVQLLSHVRLFVTPWTAAHQASLSITNSWSFLKLRSIKSVMPFNQLILCCPLLLLPSIFPSIRVFSSESVLHIRWPKDWSFSFSISPFKEYLGLISFRMD